LKFFEHDVKTDLLVYSANETVTSRNNQEELIPVNGMLRDRLAATSDHVPS